MSRQSILLVDDENSFRTLIGRELERAGYEVEGVSGIEEGRRALTRRSFDVVLLDVRMPDGSGLELLPEIKEQWPTTEVVMLTAYGTVEEAIRAMKQGAYDFLTKPCKLAELEAVLEKALEKQQLQRNTKALTIEVERLQPGDGIIGTTTDMKELFDLIARVARTDTTVLIRGESGVGKEIVARTVHKQSLRSNQPFIVVDCAALHENLLQSELFGHEKGAYTGAASLKHGLFEVANHGTLFLDEIAELTPGLQVRLLRVLQNHTFRRLGGNTDITVDVRVIAATNRSLEQMIKEGSFREDLFFRLNVVPLNIPPLRQRREDIPALVDYFCRSSSVAPRRGTHVSPEAFEVLKRYSWPGNVRELENVVERALILCDDGVIKPEHLPMGVRMAPAFEPEPGAGEWPTIEELEMRYIRRVLDHCKGHRQNAARMLGISERNLYRKLKELEQPAPGRTDT